MERSRSECLRERARAREREREREDEGERERDAARLRRSLSLARPSDVRFNVCVRVLAKSKTYINET